MCTTSHKPRQLAAFKMQHLLAEAEPHIPHPIVSKQFASWCMPLGLQKDVPFTSKHCQLIFQPVLRPACPPDAGDAGPVGRGVPGGGRHWAVAPPARPSGRFDAEHRIYLHLGESQGCQHAPKTPSTRCCRRPAAADVAVGRSNGALAGDHLR